MISLKESTCNCLHIIQSMSWPGAGWGAHQMGLRRDGGSALSKTQALSIANLQYHQTFEIVPRSCFLRTSHYKVVDDVYLHPSFHSLRACYPNTKRILQGRRKTNDCLLLILILALQVTFIKGMQSTPVKDVLCLYVWFPCCLIGWCRFVNVRMQTRDCRLQECL